MLNLATVQKIKELSVLDTKEGYQEIRQILLDYVKTNPNDIYVRLQLIKHTYSTRPVDTLDIIDYINELLDYDSNNIYALLFLAYMQRWDLTEMDESLIVKLKIYKSDNNEIMAMIAIAVSWYYELMYLTTKQKEWLIEQEKWLKKSVESCNKIVRNYYELILFYFYHGKDDQGVELIPFALKNITHVFNDNVYEDEFLQDSTNIEEFFNVRYKQVHVSKDFVEKLKSWLNY